MPKLPGIQYTVGVQSLGRRDISLPARLAVAESAALKKLPGVIEAWNFADESSDTAEKIAIYREALRTKQAELQNAKMIDVTPYGHLDLEYEESAVVEDEQGRKMVPAYMVRNKIYDYEQEQIYRDTYGTLRTQAQQKDFLSATSNLTAVSASSIVKATITETQAGQKSRYKAAIQSAVKEGNQVLAEQHLQKAYLTGHYTPEEVFEERNKINIGVQQNRINAAYTSDDKFQLMDMEDALRMNQRILPDGSLGTWDLKPKELAAQADRFERKVKRIEEAEVAQRKEDAKQRSSDVLMGGLLTMQETKEPMSMADTIVMLGNMNASDRKTFMASRKAWGKEYQSLKKEPNTEVIDSLHAEVNSLFLPGEKPPNERLAAVIESINIAQGMDPVTGDMTGKVLIHGEQASQLIQKAINAQRTVINTPAYEQAQDFMYQNMTGGTRAAFTVLDKRGPMAIVLADMERAMSSAALQAGVGFDAMAWVEDNLPRYAGDAYAKNLGRVMKEGFNKYVKTRTTKGTTGTDIPEFDLDASLEALNKDVADEVIDDETYRRIARYMMNANRNSMIAQTTGGNEQ